MSLKEETKNLSNKELIEQMELCDCDPYYRDIWEVTMDELKKRLGIYKEEVLDAVAYFKNGLSHDIFSGDMVKIAETSLKALEKMESEL